MRQVPAKKGSWIGNNRATLQQLALDPIHSWSTAADSCPPSGFSDRPPISISMTTGRKWLTWNINRSIGNHIYVCTKCMPVYLLSVRRKRPARGRNPCPSWPEVRTTRRRVASWSTSSSPSSCSDSDELYPKSVGSRISMIRRISSSPSIQWLSLLLGRLRQTFVKMWSGLAFVFGTFRPISHEPAELTLSKLVPVAEKLLS